MDEEYKVKNFQAHDLIQIVFAVFRLAKEVLIISLLIWATWAMAVTWGLVEPIQTFVISLGLTYVIVDRIVLLILGRNFLWLVLRVFVLEKELPKTGKY